jgi:glycerophosphoryl diester phosphodiesterase
MLVWGAACTAVDRSEHREFTATEAQVDGAPTPPPDPPHPERINGGVWRHGAAVRWPTPLDPTPVDMEAGPDVDHEVGPDEPSILLHVPIHGHRGGAGLRPENTFPAFELALDLGVPVLETDLHYSKDDTVVVWHDPWVMPNKCRLNPEAPPPLPPNPDRLPPKDPSLALRALPLAQLRKYVCDRNPKPVRWSEQVAEKGELSGYDYTIHTLDELAAFIERYAHSDLKSERQREGARTVLLNLESKRDHDNLFAIDDGFDGITHGSFELAIRNIVHRNNLGARAFVQGFDIRSVLTLQRLGGFRGYGIVTEDVTHAAEYAGQGLTYWAPRYADVTVEAVDEAHALGLAVVPWTINDPVEAVSAMDIKVDGLITDRPDLMIDALAERSGYP